jgi:hypothetical protein
MLTAVADGWVELEDGRRQFVKAGVTWWSESCSELSDPEIARLFGAKVRPSPRSRAVSGLPARSASSSQSRSVDILLAPKALETVKHDTFWRTGQDGLETGGSLFGFGTGERILIVRANRVGPGAKRGRDYLQMDPACLHDWYLGDSMVGRVGSWHTHPKTVEGRPSDCEGGDLPGWRAGWSRINRERFEPHYAGLILTGEEGWAYPTIHGWTVDGNGKLERAAVRASATDWSRP